jgi:DNA-binding NtrC family response regulator
MAHRYKPQAITLDIGLPDMDGWALLDLLKHDPRTRHVPIHVISVTDQRKRGLRAGAFGYLEKAGRPRGADGRAGQDPRVRRPPGAQPAPVEDDERQRMSVAALIGNGDVNVTGVGTARRPWKPSRPAASTARWSTSGCRISRAPN